MAPTQTIQIFFVELQNKVAEFDNPHNIFCGDWNLVQDQVLDTFNYLHVNNPRSKAHVEKMKKEMDLCDPWRVQFPSKRNYTWRQPNPFKQSRLDFFLISSEMLSVVHNVDILPGYRTDHSLISLTLNLNKINRGPSYWKFNNCLLKNEGFVSQIKKTIKNTVLLYARNTIEFDRNDRVVGECEFTINDQLFFETLLMMIRGEAISYGSFLKKQDVNRERELENNINIECIRKKAFLNNI